MGALSVALATNPAITFAQNKSEPSETQKEISIGSHVLKQKGDDEYSYKNEEYYYEKVWEVAGASKDELYKRVKSWLGNVADAEISRTNYDEEGKNSITVMMDIKLNDKNNGNLSRQHVTFRWLFSFKDGKIRLQGSNYRYTADYDYGIQNRQVATSYGFRNESYRNAGEYDKQFQDLRPLFKGAMRGIYEDFDAQYLKVVRDMKKNVLSDANSNW